MRSLKMFLLALPAMLVFGCASILPGNDPIVVNAERTTEIALVTFDTFLKFEYDNKEMLLKVDPGIHKFAEQLRVKAPQWLESARFMTKAYKKNRTSENKFSLTTALAVLQAGMVESQKYIKVGVTQ
jgi:hypothetical protein